MIDFRNESSSLESSLFWLSACQNMQLLSLPVLLFFSQGTSWGIISVKKAGSRSEGLWGCRYYHASHHLNFDYEHVAASKKSWYLTLAKWSANRGENVKHKNKYQSKEPWGVAELVRPDMKQKKRAEHKYLCQYISYQFQPLISVQNSSFRNQMTRKKGCFN